MRPPTGAWGLLVTEARGTAALGDPIRFTADPPEADPEHVDTTDLLGGTWLPAPPPADRHEGDLVLRLHPPADHAPDRVDVEVLTADRGRWHAVCRREASGSRWPHHVAADVLLHMRILADSALRRAEWIAATQICACLPGLAPGPVPEPGPRPVGDALAALIEAGLVVIGDEIAFDGHTATVRAGGMVRHGEREFDVSTVNALAGEIAGHPVNGWHAWRHLRTGRLLADLREALTTR
ncbi:MULTISPECIES: hypothetical protein [Actinosynnema]|uniref:hypothetical protein n=1 Tax=Actinosynnema TaxID=40566 RepID=UPI0020A39404|nr:hypothetical protein [Actinosynnema pretiosum]MCP2094695.1 hypothetical protein [Actinosynnema pretiosum]